LDREQHTILLVDDERDHLDLLSMIVRRDHRVLTAANAEEALALAGGHDIDLALVDYRMPGRNGVELLARLRDLYPDCVRFLVTAYSDAEVLTAAINEGAVYRFVAKPVDPAHLRVDIKRALEHRRVTRQLLRSEKLAVLGQLAGSVVHDLRNYLQILRVAPDLLLDPEPGDLEALAGDLRLVDSAMSDLVSELLALARGECPTYNLRPTDLGEVVREAVAVCRRAPIFAEREIEVDVARDVGPIPMAKSRVARMIGNLLQNAAEASPAGAPVGVRVRPHDDRNIRLEVWDRGAGITPAVEAHLFDPLFSTKGKAGVGLGLALCKTVVEAHRGTLTAKSAPGEGTTFTAVLPLGTER